MASEDQTSPTRHVMRLLLDDQIQEALNYVTVTLRDQIDELERRANSLRKEQGLLIKLAESQFKNGLSAPVESSVEDTALSRIASVTSSDLLDLGGATDVRQAVFSLCVEIAQRNSGVVQLVDAVEEIKRRGIELNSQRPGTSVGNMLFKSADWTRVGEGQFRWNQYKN